MSIKKGDNNTGKNYAIQNIRQATGLEAYECKRSKCAISPAQFKTIKESCSEDFENSTELKEEKGQASGYVPLDENAKVPINYLDQTFTKFAINSGSGTLISAPGSGIQYQTYEFSSPGTYNIDVPYNATAEVILVGGGAGGYVWWTGDDESFRASGGGGAYYNGKISLSAGTHTVTVGDRGTNGMGGMDTLYKAPSAGNATSIDSIVVAGGGQLGGAGWEYAYGGAGGTISVDTTKEILRVVASNGNIGGAGRNNGGDAAESLYLGYGRGGSSYPIGWWQIGPDDSTSGYAKVTITYTISSASTIFFDVSTENPLTSTNIKGDTKTYTYLDPVVMPQQEGYVTYDDEAYEYVSPGTYYINIPIEAFADVILVGGGGGGFVGSGMPGQSKGGGSGAYYNGRLRLTPGTYAVTVGGGGHGGYGAWYDYCDLKATAVGGGNTSFGNLVTAGGGGGGGDYFQGPYGGGGVAVYGGEISRTAAQNGNAGGNVAGFNGTYGGASTYGGYGAGSGSWNGTGGSGYAKVYITYPKSFVGKYKIALPKEGNNPYLINSNIHVTDKTPINIKQQGIPTINGSIVSNFSSSNYVSLLKPFCIYAKDKTWEMVFKVKFSSTSGWNSFIGDTYNGSTWLPRIGCYEGKFNICLGSTGNSYNIANGVSGTHSVQTDVYYWVKTIYDGTKYVLSYSTDGETFTDDITITSSTSIYASRVINTIGISYQASLQGEIDLEDCYININDEEWWHGTHMFGDVWLNPLIPYEAKQWNGTSWLDYEDVVLMDSLIIVDNNLITQVEQPKYASNHLMSDKKSLSSTTFPSDKYVDLTLLSSGTVYTAPANGYFYINKVLGANWYFTSLTNLNNGIQVFSDTASTLPGVCVLEVKQGDSVKVEYNAGGTLNAFKFIYAEGVTYSSLRDY